MVTVISNTVNNVNVKRIDSKPAYSSTAYPGLALQSHPMKAEIERRPQFPNQRRQQRQATSQAAFAGSFKYSKCCFNLKVGVRRSRSLCLATASALESNGAGGKRCAGTGGGSIGMSALFIDCPLMLSCLSVCQCEYVNTLICFVHQHLTSV